MSRRPKYLYVFWKDKFVGTITDLDMGDLGFEYSSEWLENEHRPVSLSLPCKEGYMNTRAATAFFENLLTEGSRRELYERGAHITYRDLVGHLNHKGNEFAGALWVSRERECRYESRGYTLLDKNIEEAWDSMVRLPLFVASLQTKDTLAGCQDKMAVYWNGKRGNPGGDFFAPKTSFDSTNYILKSEALCPEAPQNEWFCMQLARKSGFRVPKTHLLDLYGHKVFAVERFDRKMDDSGKLERIHQEDFCQILALPSYGKYEDLGGPGFRAMAAAMDEHGIKGKEDIFRITVYNFLIGNYDAHAKNFSVLHGENGLELSPFYDLFSIAVYNQFEPKFSMALGRTFHRGKVNRKSFERLAGDLGLGPENAVPMIREVTEKIMETAPEIAENCNIKAPTSMYKDILSLIEKNAKTLLRMCDTKK